MDENVISCEEKSSTQALTSSTDESVEKKEYFDFNKGMIQQLNTLTKPSDLPLLRMKLLDMVDHFVGRPEKIAEIKKGIHEATHIMKLLKIANDLYLCNINGCKVGDCVRSFGQLKSDKFGRDKWVRSQ